jgi:glucosamine-6-phosphate deaminase
LTGIDVRVAEDYDDLSRMAAEVVADAVRAEPGARILIATGETPMGTYRALAAMTAAGALDASRVTAYQLDEYLDLEPDDRRSLAGWALRTFVEPLGIGEGRFVRLPLDGDDALAEHDRRVRARGGYDLAILGVGENGHLGFNEPPSDDSAPSRRVVLSEASVRSNARYWGEDAPVPRRAVTVGLSAVLEADAVLLLASGARKRAIVERALFGPVSPDVPASYLQRARRVIAIVDRDACPAHLDRDGGPT